MISSSDFAKRFTRFVLNAREMPKKQADQNAIFHAATLGLEGGKAYSEADLNHHLQRWADRFGGSCKLDYVSLRRYLVDRGFIDRDASGGAYSLAASGPRLAFDPQIEALDLDQLVLDEVAAREARKQEHLRRSRD